MKVPQLVLIVSLAVFGYLAYLYYPSAARVAGQTKDQVQKDEIANNWEYYYDQEVGKMEQKLQEFEKTRESTIAESIRFQEQRDVLAKKIADSNSMIQRVASDYKAAEAAGTSTIVIAGVSKDLEGAKAQIATWIDQRMRLESQLAKLDDAVTRTQEVRKREAAAFQKSRAQIEALKREKVFMKSDLAMKDIENRLRELEGISNKWFESKDLSGLEQVRGIMKDKLLSAEARRQLLAEEDNIDKQVGLDEALRNQTTEQANTQVQAELDALLGGKKQ